MVGSGAAGYGTVHKTQRDVENTAHASLTLDRRRQERLPGLVPLWQNSEIDI